MALEPESVSLRMRPAPPPMTASSRFVTAKILHLEDDDTEATRVHEQLAAAGIAAEFAQVKDAPGFEREITRDSFDLILASDKCADCNGVRALSLALERTP